jgi:hypothetical protein
MGGGGGKIGYSYFESMVASFDDFYLLICRVRGRTMLDDLM